MAGWKPGDVYDPSNPTAPIRTKNARLLLMQRGVWSQRLVDGLFKNKRRNWNNYARKLDEKDLTMLASKYSCFESVKVKA